MPIKEASEELLGYDDGDLTVRSAHYIALARGEVLVLPRRVLFLLFELARSPGSVRSRADLAEAAWGSVGRRIKLQSIDQSISRLRGALGEALPGLSYVHTHPGAGYRFERELAEDGERVGSDPAR
jgi:DNA-binding winged helix-turn-helix (wHTH) protein